MRTDLDASCNSWASRYELCYVSDYHRAALQTVIFQPTYLLSCFAECRGGMFSVLRLLATLAQELPMAISLQCNLLATDPYSVSYFPCADL